MPIQISDRLKHLIPKGEGKVEKRFNIVEFANHLKNNDFIMSGEEKREILQKTENLLICNAGELELSTELNYSGPRMVSRMSSDADLQDFQ